VKSIHQGLEKFFRALALSIYHRPIRVLFVVFLAAGAMVSQLPRLTIDTSNEGFFRKDSDILVRYRAFHEQYGQENVIVISVEPDMVFDFGFLAKLKIFHEELEKTVPHLDEVTSLLTARNTRGEGDQLIVEDLFEQWPVDQAELDILRRRALANPFYRNLLLSDDGRVTAVIVRPSNRTQLAEDFDVLSGFDGEMVPAEEEEPTPLLTDQQWGDFVAAILAVVEKYNGESFRLAASGMPAVTDRVKRYIIKDMGRFTAAALLIIVILLFLMFRRFSGVFIPVSTVILTVLSTLGLMAITGTSFKAQTQILPSFLLAVGTASSIHILSMFYKRFDETGLKRQSIADAMAHSAAPVLMACITTAVGLMSFSGAEVLPIAELGIFSGVGILVSLLYTLVMTPALLALLPVKSGKQKTSSAGKIGRILERIARFSITYPRMIVAVCVVGLFISIVGLSRLSVYNNFLEWFPPSEPVRQGIEKIDAQLKGVSTLEMVIDTGRENGLYDPQLLQTLDALSHEVQSIRHNNIVSEKTLSIADIVKEINQALNEGNPEYYLIPNDRNLIAQELLLFESTGTDDLEDIVDSQFSQTRMSIKFNWSDSTSINEYATRVRALFEQRLPGDYGVHETGSITIYSHIAVATIDSMQRSYLLAVILISVLMVLFVGNLKIGLIAMIPNLLPIFMTMGAMGFLGFPLDLFTMYIGSIAIGLAVDDTLHFLHGFNRFHRQTGSTSQAIVLTFRTTGRAIFVTSLVLAGGFFIYILSTMGNISRFGILTGTTIVLALVADFVLTPAILFLAVRDRKGQSDEYSLEAAS
jgi:hypothetical protein